MSLPPSISTSAIAVERWDRRRLGKIGAAMILTLSYTKNLDLAVDADDHV
jgi:hypothetical protein